MPISTNLNTAPYYDDFDEDDNFQRILFRPGFAIQARELTQLQSILQNQIEQHGRHTFRDGAMVIPGHQVFDNAYQSIKLEPIFGGETIDPSQYYDADNPVTLTGQTSGVTAEVIGFSPAGGDTDEPLLYLNYVSSGNSGDADPNSSDFSIVFQKGEALAADIPVTHTTTYGSGVSSLNVFNPTDPNEAAATVGSVVKVKAGVYFVKGQFVSNSAQTLVLGYNTPRPNARVGFTVTETIVTPESDTTLLDNATGTSNFAAKGAHRLQVNLTLDSKPLDSSDDANFSEIMRIEDGQVITKAKETTYSLLGNELARRTYEESGNYIVKPFKLNIAETIDNFIGKELFLGEYNAGDNTEREIPAQDDFLTVKIQPGSAYVNGYRHETLGLQRLDLLKARDVKTIDNQVVNAEIGNFLKLTNVYGSPDIGDISDETTPYRPILLLNNTQSSRGTVDTVNKDLVGVVRARSFEHESNGTGGTAGGSTAGASSNNDDGVYRLYVFDVQNFVKLTMSDTPSPTLTANFASGGVEVTGVTSGAKGFVYNDTTSFPDTTFTSGATIFLTNVIGEFEAGEKIKASDDTNADLIVQNSGGTDLTITTSTIRKLSDARSVEMQESDDGQDFVADIVLENLEGERVSLFLDESDDSATATGSTTEKKTVGQVGSDGGEGIILETAIGARLQEPEKLQSIFKLPKDVIKTLLTETNNGVPDTQVTFRRQFVGTTSASGVVSFRAGSGETFVDFAEKDFTMSILTAGGGTGSQGDIVSVSGKTGGHNTSVLTVTDNSILGSAAKVKMLATIKKTAVTQATKETILSKKLRVLATDADGAYGTRVTDKDISLGRTDVFNIQAIYDSEDSSSDATVPSLTVSSITGSFERGERIKGETSGARGRLVTASSPLEYNLIFGEGAIDFQDGETITGEFSGATAVIDTDGVTAGSKLITDDFLFDDGQKNNFYDIGRLVRKENVPAPTGRMLVIYDYFSHGSGNFFSVDSYTAVSGIMKYEEIPIFVATTVDPDDPAPSSTFPLADCLDFRPTVENIAGTSETITVIDQVTGHSFDHGSRQYDGTGSIVVDTPKPNSEIRVDFEFYLPKIACLFLDSEGTFRILEGEPNENPAAPTPLTRAQKIAEFLIPPFTFNADDVSIQYEKLFNYTMRDIGNLEKRIQALEYYTSLSLLESETLSKEIVDQNGLNRFKAGFLIDPFRNHSVGDLKHPDYNVAVDSDARELRPTVVDKAATLVLDIINSDEQLASGFQQTGKLVTLPYENESFINNQYEIKDTTTVGVDPNPNATYAGRISELDPSEDEWFEVETRVGKPVTDSSDYDAAIRANGGKATKYTYGKIESYGYPYQRYGGTYGDTTTANRGYTGNYSGKISRTSSGDAFLYEFYVKQKQRRLVTVKSVGSKSDTHTDTKLIQEDITFCRPKGIKFTAGGLKPNTKHYVFFGGKDVSNFSGPLEEQFAIDPSEFTPFSNTDVDVGDSLDIVPGREQPNEGVRLKTNNKGELKGFFLIPDHRGKQNSSVPKFETGDIEFRVTSNTKNDKLVTISLARTIFNASGTREVTETTTITTKKPVYSSSSYYAEGTYDRIGYSFGTKELGRLFNRSHIIQLQFSNVEGWVQDNLIYQIQVGVLIAKKNGIQISRSQAYTLKNDRSSVTLTVADQYRIASPGTYERSSGNLIEGVPPVKKEAYYQSFYVSQTEGMFMTAVDLYFQTRSKTDPVHVSLVTIKEGFPSMEELPYSLVTLSPEEVNVDMTGETATRITFPSPIHLGGLEKYALKIYSRGDMYKLKTGRESIGETKHALLSDVFLPGRVITDGGDNDLHARLNIIRAKFTDDAISDGGVVRLRNKFVGELYSLEDSSKSAYGKKLFLPNPLELRNSVTKIKVSHEDHGMYSTSNNVRISGVRSGVTTTLNGAISRLQTTLVLRSVAGFTEGSTHVPSSGSISLKIDNEMFTGTLSGNTFSISGRGTDGFGATSGESVAHSDGATVELYMLHGIPLQEINKVHNSISDIEMHSYVISVSTAPTVGGDGTIRVGGTRTFASENYRFEKFLTYVPNVEPPRTAINSKVITTTGTSPSGSETSFSRAQEKDAIPFALNHSYEVSDCSIVASNENEELEMGNDRSFILNLTLSSDSNFVSPVIDTTNMSVFLEGNDLDNIDSASDVYTPSGADSNYRASTEPRGDNNSAVYLSKPVQLENTATSIRLLLDVHKPATSDVLVLFRTLPVEGEEDIKNTAFTFFNGNGLPDIGFATNAQDRDDFVEYEYTAGVNDSGIGQPLQDFQQFQIKIVLQGTDAAQPPRLMNLRAIALAT